MKNSKAKENEMEVLVIYAFYFTLFLELKVSHALYEGAPTTVNESSEDGWMVYFSRKWTQTYYAR